MKLENIVMLKEAIKHNNITFTIEYDDHIDSYILEFEGNHMHASIPITLDFYKAATEPDEIQISDVENVRIDETKYKKEDGGDLYIELNNLYGKIKKNEMESVYNRFEDPARAYEVLMKFFGSEENMVKAITRELENLFHRNVEHFADRELRNY